MQFMPNNFLTGWDALACLPPNQTEKLFAKAIAAESRNAVNTVGITDVLKAMAKADVAPANPTIAKSILAIIRLLSIDIYNLQITDGSALRKKLGKQISKLRGELTDADEALFEAIGGALSEDSVAPAEAPVAIVGANANVISISDAGVETNLISGKQRLYATTIVVDGTRAAAADASTITVHPTLAETIQLVRSV